MARIATAHLIHGYIGAGKTTLARRLEAQHDAVRFTPDDWMAELFGADPPAGTFRAHADRVLGAMAPTWSRCLTLGVDVVLDFGFWSRADRDAVRATVSALGARARLYAVVCDEHEARRRISARNTSPERSLFIAPATYDALLRRYEPLHADEMWELSAGQG